MIASQAGATLNNLLSHAQELVAKLRSMQLDQREFVCLKFLVLFSLGESLKALKRGVFVAGSGSLGAIRSKDLMALLSHGNYKKQTPEMYKCHVPCEECT